MRTNEALGILPALAIAILSWFYSIFILNRFRGLLGFTRSELLAIPLYLAGGYAAWIAELCILNDDLASLQLCSALYRSFVNWIGFILVVNERLAISRQQFGSLLFVLGITALWELQHRVVLVDISGGNSTCDR
jgi:hypothetical protein